MEEAAGTKEGLRRERAVLSGVRNTRGCVWLVGGEAGHSFCCHGNGLMWIRSRERGAVVRVGDLDGGGETFRCRLGWRERCESDRGTVQVGVVTVGGERAGREVHGDVGATHEGILDRLRLEGGASCTKGVE